MQRSSHIRKLFFALAAIIISSACTSGPSLPPLAPDAKILAFGDSLTRGTGAEPSESYPEVLSRIIGRTVVNAGIPGEISADGAARLAGLLESERPQLVIICHGGNDFLQRLDRQETARNLLAMVRMARERHISVILIAVPELGLALTPHPLYSEVAATEGVPLEKKALSTILGKGTLKSDYIHPNAAGYRHLAEAVAALLKKSGALSL
jgi:lysophospholipase L1-like esterase